MKEVNLHGTVLVEEKGVLAEIKGADLRKKKRMTRNSRLFEI